jgi:dTDP-4-amino-4,6-dideoxy-D-galactose acyltransferase
MDSTAQETCQLLDWDTQFFGIRIAQVTAPILTDEIAKATLQWCRAEKISCLYYLVPCDHAKPISLAEKFNFHLVDIRLTFERSSKISTEPQAYRHIRRAEESDIPLLREIARQAYRNTRFYNDGNFTVHQCENLYMTWIEKSCQGYADSVWVASPGNEPGGFITCHRENGTGQIGLLGIHPSYHRQGWGEKLVKSALRWFSEHSCTPVKVVTQGNNRAAQKLYEQCGFHLSSVQLWYHHWFDPFPQEG